MNKIKKGVKEGTYLLWMCMEIWKWFDKTGMEFYCCKPEEYFTHSGISWYAVIAVMAEDIF